jgi:hypothetical protein
MSVSLEKTEYYDHQNSHPSQQQIISVRASKQFNLDILSKNRITEAAIKICHPNETLNEVLFREKVIVVSR